MIKHEIIKPAGEGNITRKEDKTMNNKIQKIIKTCEKKNIPYYLNGDELSLRDSIVRSPGVYRGISVLQTGNKMTWKASTGERILYPSDIRVSCDNDIEIVINLFLDRDEIKKRNQRMRSQEIQREFEARNSLDYKYALHAIGNRDRYTLCKDEPISGNFEKSFFVVPKKSCYRNPDYRYGNEYYPNWGFDSGVEITGIMDILPNTIYDLEDAGVYALNNC